MVQVHSGALFLCYAIDQAMQQYVILIMISVVYAALTLAQMQHFMHQSFVTTTPTPGE